MAALVFSSMTSITTSLLPPASWRSCCDRSATAGPCARSPDLRPWRRPPPDRDDQSNQSCAHNSLDLVKIALARSARPGGRRVGGHGLLGGEAAQIVGTAGLWSGPRQAAAAEWLGAHHGADHAAVHIDVAVGEARRDVVHGPVDARMDA